jgi:hypothetical protein
VRQARWRRDGAGRPCRQKISMPSACRQRTRRQLASWMRGSHRKPRWTGKLQRDWICDLARLRWCREVVLARWLTEEEGKASTGAGSSTSVRLDQPLPGADGGRRARPLRRLGFVSVGVQAIRRATLPAPISTPTQLRDQVHPQSSSTQQRLGRPWQLARVRSSTSE